MYVHVRVHDMGVSCDECGGCGSVRMCVCARERIVCRYRRLVVRRIVMVVVMRWWWYAGRCSGDGGGDDDGGGVVW